VNKTCDICGEGTELSLLSSRIAPVTYAICRNCSQRGAENIGVVSFWIASYGGPDEAPEFRDQLISWIDGRYVGWEVIERYFQLNEGAIKQAFKEEFLLLDDDP